MCNCITSVPNYMIKIFTIFHRSSSSHKLQNWINIRLCSVHTVEIYTVWKIQCIFTKYTVFEYTVSDKNTAYRTNLLFAVFFWNTGFRHLFCTRCIHTNYCTCFCSVIRCIFYKIQSFQIGVWTNNSVFDKYTGGSQSNKMTPFFGAWFWGSSGHTFSFTWGKENERRLILTLAN